MITPRALSYFAISLLGLGLVTPLTAQETPEDAPSTSDRLTDVKALLIDETPGFYVSPNLSASVFAGDFDVDGEEIEFDGYFVRGGAAAGYQLQNIRVELDATIGNAELDLTLPDALADAFEDKESVFFITATVGVYYDFDFRLDQLISSGIPAAAGYLPPIRPYVGGASGLIYVDFEEIGDDDVAYLANAMAGLGIRINPRLHLDLGYRLFYIPRTEPAGIDVEITAHTTEFRLRYRF